MGFKDFHSSVVQLTAETEVCLTASSEEISHATLSCCYLFVVHAFFCSSTCLSSTVFMTLVFVLDELLTTEICFKLSDSYYIDLILQFISIAN